VTRRRIIAGGAVALLLVVDALFGRPEHPHAWFESIPFFWVFLGFGGTWLLVLAAKSVLARWFARPSGYYDA
jgi:hypothetical protein